MTTVKYNDPAELDNISTICRGSLAAGSSYSDWLDPHDPTKLHIAKRIKLRVVDLPDTDFSREIENLPDEIFDMIVKDVMPLENGNINKEYVLTIRTVRELDDAINDR